MCFLNVRPDYVILFAGMSRAVRTRLRNFGQRLPYGSKSQGVVFWLSAFARCADCQEREAGEKREKERLGEKEHLRIVTVFGFFFLVICVLFLLFNRLQFDRID